MDLTHYARTMSEYNRWMNERLYEACAALPDEQRKRDAGAFFKSIHGTLNHLLLADRVWMGRFTGAPFKVTSLAQELYTDYGELRAERARTDQAICDWAAELSLADFERELRYTSIDKPEPRMLPMGRTILHFFNHQTHHRGQVTALMKQAGVDPGVTDLLFLPGR